MTPREADIFALIDRSWPPAAAQEVEGWLIRKGLGGSKRTMAATRLSDEGSPRPWVGARDDWEPQKPSQERGVRSPVNGVESPSLGEGRGLPGGAAGRTGGGGALSVASAERAMGGLCQPLMFQIRGEDRALDAELHALGYAIVDPCVIYAGRAEKLAAPLPPVRCWTLWPPLAIQRDIWAEGGIGPGRVDIMERAGGPKASILARIDDQPAGAGFVSSTGGLAMLHALETRAKHRRKGVGRDMMRAAANWCVAHGIEWLTLIVTERNAAARQLYEGLGMTEVGRYHYRIKEGP
ncbi:MAG: GNAT family N-acetyltransferase [Shimia sp.]